MHSCLIYFKHVYYFQARIERLCILSSEDTITYILQHECSVARFGEGEFELIFYYYLCRQLKAAEWRLI